MLLMFLCSFVVVSYCPLFLWCKFLHSHEYTEIRKYFCFQSHQYTQTYTSLFKIKVTTRRHIDHFPTGQKREGVEEEKMR